MAEQVDRTRRALCVGLGLALGAGATGLAGCSAVNLGPTPPPKPELSRLRVGVVPMLDSAAYYVALRNNLFNQNQVSVNTVQTVGAEDSLPELLAGHLDVTFGNYVSIVAACARNEPIRVIADAAAASPGSFQVVANPHQIRKPTELIGKRIAVNTLNNMATLLVSTALIDQDIQPSQITYVPIPFPNMIDALAHGQVDAAFLPEPFVTQAEVALGVEPILDPIIGPTVDMPMDGYVVTESFLKKYPRSVDAFRNAIQTASQQAARRPVVEAAVNSAFGIPRNVLALTALPRYSSTLNPIRVQRVADLMTSQGLLPRPVQMRQFISGSKAG